MVTTDKHSDGFDKRRPLTIVTAAIDRIELQKSIVPFHDLEIVGRVTCTGKSSMEIRIEVYSICKDFPAKNDELHAAISAEGVMKKSLVMVSYFVMVALDKTTGKSAPVHPIVPETEEDKIIYDIGKENQIRRKLTSEESLMKKPPNEAETKIIHNMFLQKMKQPHITNDSEAQNNSSVQVISMEEGQEPVSCLPMSFTKLSNIKIMHPTNRNIHGKIFGGYLLKEAYELGFLTVSFFLCQDLKEHFNSPIDTPSISPLS